MNVPLELYKRAINYLNTNSVPLPVEATKPELQEELRIFYENVKALDVQALCNPTGVLKDFPLPYLVKLLAAACQYQELEHQDALAQANIDVRVSRGVLSAAPGSGVTDIAPEEVTNG